VKKILICGAGKSATCLIDFLLDQAAEFDWQVIVCDADLSLAERKIDGRKTGTAVSIDIEEDHDRNRLIQDADIVISLLPPALHLLVAKECLKEKKHLLTASYVDEDMKALSKEAAKAGVLFLCEMGLDPGIDHMSAMKIIDQIRGEGGTITSFMSHCGGLVAPESDDNPWHYKISWNPRNIIMAGKSGAKYKQDGKMERMPYEYLFDSQRAIKSEELGWLSWYPNRDSTKYMELYGLEDADTFIRTTLRYPEFIFGWKNIIDLKLTDQYQHFDSTGLSYKQFFAEHLARFNATGILADKISNHLSETKRLLQDLQSLTEAEEEARELVEPGELGEDLTNFMVVEPDGEIKNIELEDVKKRAGVAVATKLHETKLMMEQLDFLGLDSEEPVNLGSCTAVDVLQSILEKKLALTPGDKDMVVMVHQIEYVDKEGNRKQVESSLIVKGEDHVHTAMAKTVGLPLGIAAVLILSGRIQLTGVRIPVVKEIYEPVLKELEKYGIRFKEKDAISASA
jgi:saccharopine dehydrogenase-like NADP-dependent oxidoreductase